MCLVVVAWQTRPDLPLVAAGNRDELHDRPTAPASWWPEGLLAGRDLRAGGTWMGVSRRGRFAVVTNVRDPAEFGREARSRGELPLRWLREEATVEQLYAERDAYGAFNLLIGDRDHLWYVGARVGLRALEPGLYGLSNAALDTPWPKLTQLKARAAAGLDEANLLAALSDTQPAADADLPDTGVGLELERYLSPAFLVGPRYGTRASTVITPGSFFERRYGPMGVVEGESRFGW